MKKKTQDLDSIFFNPFFYQTDLLAFAPEEDEDILIQLTGSPNVSLQIQECDLIFIAGPIHKKNRKHFEKLLDQMLAPKLVLHIEATHLDFNPNDWIPLSQIIAPDVTITQRHPFGPDYKEAIIQLKQKVLNHE
jgi:hypothetical protein